MKCYICGKRITIENSFKIANNYEDRICRECVQQGRGEIALEQLKYNKEAEKSITY